ncbi:hypothetical protein Rhe02_10330 [Rhizocola hellebori]|uniref:Beta-lactamase-related domain-containing protein n=1 Tax=Rhizocola hellebori TaxID=1392758 RepID=A0A8J3VE34_9ACTN|nr:serine hydrolase domain-containing protein [Rhizocola hellebori]GIH02966.1 hypothetical protein Rhe02_10330 [Rhizocola hellebori]
MSSLPDSWAFLGTFSGTVLVARPQEAVLKRAYGLADRARNAPNTVDTKFNIASMGKMFTGVAVAQLTQSFGDSAARYVPGLAPEITLHHLLTHTSGLAEALGPELPTVAQIVAQRPVSKPGSSFAYSNAGFIVLGAVIEKISGMPYAAYVRSHVLEPAGMTATGIEAYRPRDVAGMALGYLPDGGDSGDRVHVANPSGGAYSTVSDMYSFATALQSGKLLPAPLVEMVTAGKVDANRPGGPPMDRYAYGFSDQTVNGIRIVGHNGGTPGYEAQLDIYPQREQVAVLLSNVDRGVMPVARQAQDLLTGSR